MQISMCDVSIIIPVYNVNAFVADCIKSVINQDCTNSYKIECLIIDDCGTDNSMEIVAGIIAEYSGPINFRIIRRPNNGGLSAARNTGIQNSKGKYVYFLDSDDLITSDCIRLLMDRACFYPSAQIITGDFQTFPQKDVHRALSLQNKNFPDFSDNLEWIRSIFLSKFPVTAWNKLILRDFITTNKLYFKEGVIHEDNHWIAIAYHVVSAVAFVDNVTYMYRMRQDSITNINGAMRRKMHNFQIIFSDVLSRKVAWDQNWDNWIAATWYTLLHGEYYESVRNEATDTARLIARTSADNQSCPVGLRLVYRLLSLPSGFYWERMALWLRFKLNKRLPKVGKVDM